MRGGRLFPTHPEASKPRDLHIMDSKQLNQLDPKLKETYERVMGTSTVPIQKPFIPNPTVVTNPLPITPQPITQKPLVQSQPIHQSVQSFQAKPIQAQPTQPQSMQKSQLQNLKKKNKILPALAALGGIIFLIGYAFFWIKFFNLKLPFLPF